MTRLHLTFFFVLFLGMSFAFSDEAAKPAAADAVAIDEQRSDNDPIRAKLNEEKVSYKTAIEKYRASIATYFDKREELARKKVDNKALVDQIKSERDEFEMIGKLPKSAPAAAKSQLTLARSSFESAYRVAIRQYTMAKKDDEASAVEEELNTFLTESDGLKWVSLFNGKNLNGWVFDGGDEQNFRIEEGVIVAAGTDSKTRSYILTQRDYTNFIIRLEFKPEQGTGGGIAIRAVAGEHLPLKTKAGTVISIFDHPIFKVFDKGNDAESTGTTHWICNVMHRNPDNAAVMKPLGEWNQFEAMVRGHSLKASVNGKLVIETTLPEGAMLSDGSLPALSRTKGRIGIQKHTGTIRYRNIEVAELR